MPSRNAVYEERNRLVALISKVFPSCIGIDEKEEEGWQHVIYVDLPTGQCSWHIPDFQLEHFSHLDIIDVEYDGHTTEEKYQRIENLTTEMINQLFA